MSTKNQLLPKDKARHHAYLAEVETEVVSRFLEDEWQIKIHGNPDFWCRSFDVFTVDDSRMLKDLHAQKPIAGEKKIYVVGLRSATEEAQNALLKMLEEPTGNSIFFFAVSNRDALLPTLRSRFEYLPFDSVGAKQADNEWNAFFKASPAKRLTLIEVVVKEKDFARALSLIESLEKVVPKEKLAYVFDAKKYLSRPSGSIKQVLEWLSLVL